MSCHSAHISPSLSPPCYSNLTTIYVRKWSAVVFFKFQDLLIASSPLKIRPKLSMSLAGPFPLPGKESDFLARLPSHSYPLFRSEPANVIVPGQDGGAHVRHLLGVGRPARQGVQDGHERRLESLLRQRVQNRRECFLDPHLSALWRRNQTFREMQQAQFCSLLSEKQKASQC